MVTDIPLPVLTFPKEVADFVRRTYSEARVILEYGSGGSTFLAASALGKHIVSVESDPAWAQRMREIANAHNLPSPPTIVYADIGPVGAWARALDHRHLAKFIGYAQGVWASPDFAHPDVVLVDGRFRAACFMTAYLSAERPITLLFDDYSKRREYHVIERLLKPTRMVGRMAVFHIRPEDRQEVEPWLLLSTYFEAVCSFRVGVSTRRPKLKRRVISGLSRLFERQPQGDPPTPSTTPGRLWRKQEPRQSP